MIFQLEDPAHETLSQISPVAGLFVFSLDGLENYRVTVRMFKGHLKGMNNYKNTNT